MTEREMLELAAKAARIKLLIWQEGGMQPGFLLQDDRRLWNPLADDGDALRLSSMLRLSIRSHSDGSVSISWYDKGGFFAGNVVEEYGSLRNGDHPTAHVRRAITRAAAEIGKQMGGGDV